MKSISYFVVGLLILSSFAAIGFSKEAIVQKTNIEKKEYINNIFSTPQVIQTEIQDESYLELRINEGNGYLHQSGNPILPISRNSLTLPFGSRIIDISCEVGTIKIMTLTDKIIPAPNNIVTNMQNTEAVYHQNQAIYNSYELFPKNWFDYSVGVGLDENSEHKTFLNIWSYPARYSPLSNEIHYVDNMNIEIIYELSDKNPFLTVASYDMVIIAPNVFSDEIQSLITHKNRYGIETILKTTESIYNEYEGVDKPEEIKYFIKDAIETLGVKYVMLVGGMTSLIIGKSRDDQNQGTKDWHIPVRYTNLQESGGTYDPGFISDLYYADIYEEGGAFSSWDKDKNGESDGTFAYWRGLAGFNRDIIDLYPDVYVGRLACRNENEVKTVVSKIIDYERLKHKSNWYDTMILIGGDSHDDSGTNYNEGEVACDYVQENYMSEFNPVKLYASNKDIKPEFIPSPTNIVNEITRGAGHLLFEGHGHPGSWNTHWPGIFSWGDTPGGIDVADFSGIKNGLELPVVVIGGCHNSQFNVTLTATTLEEPFMWTHGEPVAECFSWHLVRLSTGGTIASLGNTGLGYGAIGNHGDQDGDGIDLPDTLEAVGGYQIHMFYKTIAEGKDILGEVWGGAEKKYLDTYPGMKDLTDAKTVEQWPLLGDPSLKIGGYQTDGKAKNINNYPILLQILENILEKYLNAFPLLREILEK